MNKRYELVQWKTVAWLIPVAIIIALMRACEAHIANGANRIPRVSHQCTIGSRSPPRPAN